MYNRPKASVDSRISALEHQVKQLSRIVQLQAKALRQLIQAEQTMSPKPKTTKNSIEEAARQVIAFNNRRAGKGRRRF